MGRPGKGTDSFEASDQHYHEQFMENYSSASYSKLDDDRPWSSQQWKTETMTYDRSGRPDKTSWRMVRKVRHGHEEILLDRTAQSVRNEETLDDRSGRPDDINSREEARPQQFVIGSDETYGCNNGISNIHGKELPVQLPFHREHKKDLTLKQMFDISSRLVSEQDEISGLETIGWEIHSWKYLSLTGDERIINLQRRKVYVFSDSVLCLGKIQQNPESHKAWEERLGWITSSQSYRNSDRIDGEPTKFEWNIFPGFGTLQLCDKVKSLLSKLGETPEIFTRRILFMSMFNDISCGTRDNEQEWLANARLVSFVCKKIW